VQVPILIVKPTTYMYDLHVRDDLNTHRGTCSDWGGENDLMGDSCILIRLCGKEQTAYHMKACKASHWYWSAAAA